MTVGCLEKMVAVCEVGQPVYYNLKLDDELISLNPLIGQEISLEFTGKISCGHCGKSTRKNYGGGYCYPCFIKLPQADMCMMKPETCHFSQGSCRDEAWGLGYCFQDHIVYLANSSGLKVGITRASQMPTRWLDQGAVQAVALCRVQNRKDSGRVEVWLKQYFADKTNWRVMLKGEPPKLDLEEQARKVLPLLPQDVPLQVLDLKELNFSYPVEKYPEKIVSHNFDKNPLLSGKLQGIKGQYLIFDHCVINIRKYGGYQVRFSIG